MGPFLHRVVLELWQRANDVSAIPSPVVLAIACAGGSVLVVQRSAWKATRHVVTLVHEGGHAVMAVVTGGAVEGIRLNRDTSGMISVAISAKRPLLGAMTSFAGYPAPAALALGFGVAIHFGRAPAALGVLGCLLLLGLVFVRNLWGLALAVTAVAGVLAALAYSTPKEMVVGEVVVASSLLCGSMRTMLEHHRRRVQGQLDRRSLAPDVYGVAARLHCAPGLVDFAWWVTWAAIAACSVLLVGHHRL